MFRAAHSTVSLLPCEGLQIGGCGCWKGRDLILPIYDTEIDERDPKAIAAETPESPAGDEYLPDAEPLFDDSEPDFDGIDF